jgi:CHAT domain
MELCKLCRQENGRVVEGPFLCEGFALTRWLHSIALKPSLKHKNLALVVPADAGLAFAAGERDYLLSLANGGRQARRIPATFLAVREALASGVYDGWHFSGHGGFRESDPNRSRMYLENQETLTPEDLSGRVSNLGRAKPVVFFNACQIGRSAMSLTDIGGWARQFLHAGAGAFIGAYWSIYDQPVYDFAKELYSRLFSGKPIGRVVQKAHTAIKLQVIRLSWPIWCLLIR